MSFWTLFSKELLRFWKVSVQTVAAPVLTALLYLVIFAHALDGRVQVFDGVRYTAFLVPGLVMMSVLQNAFANSSSSLIQSKITGNIVFILLPPISYAEFFGAYVPRRWCAAWRWARACSRSPSWFVDLRLEAPLWALAFALLGAALLGALGLLAGICRRRSTSSPRSRTSSSCRSPCSRACSTRSTRCPRFWRGCRTPTRSST